MDDCFTAFDEQNSTVEVSDAKVKSVEREKTRYCKFEMPKEPILRKELYSETNCSYESDSSYESGRGYESDRNYEVVPRKISEDTEDTAMEKPTFFIGSKPMKNLIGSTVPKADSKKSSPGFINELEQAVKADALQLERRPKKRILEKRSKKRILGRKRSLEKSMQSLIGANKGDSKIGLDWNQLERELKTLKDVARRLKLQSEELRLEELRMAEKHSREKIRQLETHFEERQKIYLELVKKKNKSLARLEWVESYQVFGESDDSHVEIVYKFGQVPQVPDIVNLFGENILSSINYKEGSKDKWFEENILDENCDMKEIYAKELISKRFPWVKDFYIGATSDPENSWQIYITYARNTVPSMKDLKKLFGVNIASFVDFIQGSEDKKLPTSSCFLRAPSSGDTLYVQNKGLGTIGILCTRISETDNHYAVTCYHVCYCKTALPENLEDAHEILKGDCGSNASAGCSGAKCHYTKEKAELGKFECGLYDDRNDIALIELASELTCEDATALLKEGVESELLDKKEVKQIFTKYKDNGKLPKVKKYGSMTEETEGELFAISGAPRSNGMNRGFYRIRGAEKSDFAILGDSGSLVYIEDEGKNLPFAIVSNREPGENVFYCPNLRHSMEALGKKYRSMRIQPCLNKCGRLDISSTEKND